LAGGDAGRIGGIAKGTLKIAGGVSIIERLISELNKTGIEDIIIIANNSAPYRHYGREIIADTRAGIGPIAGIEAGLRHFAGRTDAVMFLPCDLPQFTTKEMAVLKQAFVEGDDMVVFAQTPDKLYHPLCAIVHTKLIEEISAAIDRGARRPERVWRQAKGAAVQFADDTAFFNINTPAHIDEWRNKR